MGKNWKVWTKRSIWERRSVKRVSPKIEVNRRISSTMPIMKRLDLFWKQARVPTKWKIQVFDAVCVSKLLYSLEALQPTEAAASKLDTFQLKGLRKIWKMSTTHIDRTNTNHEVYRRANLEMGRGAEEIIRPLSDVLHEKRRKVLGHIIRRPRDHPQHQATFATIFFCHNKLNKEGWGALERRVKQWKIAGAKKITISTEKVLFDNFFFHL